MPDYRFPSLRGRVVLVTGGSRGLGRTMALALAEAGARVAVTGQSDSPALRDTVKAANALGGGDAHGFVADVRLAAECERAVGEVVARFGRVDVLVNNAGLGMRPVSEAYIEHPPKFWESDPAACKSIIDTNVTGVLNMSRYAVPGMVERRFGKVINLSTSLAVMSRAGQSPYGPSKAAVESMSRIWVKDLEGTGVDVNVLLPGAATNGGTLPDKRRAQPDILPASIMKPVILWLCADESNGWTGGRYLARKWDVALPCDEAARRASEPWPV